MADFDTRFGLNDIYIYRLPYCHIIQMMYFNHVFGDAPLGGFGIYVILHVAYGRTYVEIAYDDGLLLSRGALCEAVLGRVVELVGKDNVEMPQCHHVAYSGQQ